MRRNPVLMQCAYFPFLLLQPTLMILANVWEGRKSEGGKSFLLIKQTAFLQVLLRVPHWYPVGQDDLQSHFSLLWAAWHILPFLVRYHLESVQRFALLLMRDWKAWANYHLLNSSFGGLKLPALKMLQGTEKGRKIETKLDLCPQLPSSCCSGWLWILRVTLCQSRSSQKAYLCIRSS